MEDQEMQMTLPRDLSLDIQSERESQDTTYLVLEDYDEHTTQKIVKELLMPYLNEIFADLYQRQEINNQDQGNCSGINRITFKDYCGLPEVLSDRFFAVIDQDGDGIINQQEFVHNLAQIYMGDLQAKLRFTFQIYDRDRDEKITHEEIRFIMSHIPFVRSIENETPSSLATRQKHFFEEGKYNRGEGKITLFKDRLADQEQIEQFLIHIFESRGFNDQASSAATLSYEEFVEINKSVSSEMFYSVLSVIYERLPCSQNFFKMRDSFLIMMEQKKQTAVSPANKIAYLNVMTRSVPGSPIQSPKSASSNQGSKRGSRKNSGAGTTFPHPKLNLETISNFSGMMAHKKQELSQDLNCLSPFPRNTAREEQSQNKPSLLQQLHVNVIKQKSQRAQNAGNSPLLRNQTEGIRNEGIVVDAGEYKRSQFAKQKQEQAPQVISSFSDVQEEEEKQPKQDQAMEVDEEDSQETHILAFDNIVSSKYQIKHQGYGIMKGEQTGMFQRNWISIFGRELYIYKSQHDPAHLKLHSLSGAFVIVEPAIPIQTLDLPFLYPISVIFGTQMNQQLFFESSQEQSAWSESLKQACGYTNLYDYYEIIQPIGQGQFGQVQMALHRSTGEKVAVKKMNKENMSHAQQEMQRREIEILKMCQHPNVIRLLDVFENHKYFYIVLEFLEGGDLYDYMKERQFQISEERARELAEGLSCALYYLHSYGIVHRDLKLENIMMTSKSDSSEPKLVDFGLSKILGPEETTTDPFGTVGYAAPEILKKLPYGKSVDIWSLGVIIYVLLNGAMPFFVKGNEQETMRQTLHEPVKFTNPRWAYISPAARALVKELLRKTPTNRMTLEGVLKSEWITSGPGMKTNEKKDQRLRVSSPSMKFAAFSQQ